ncbi:MFS general substrate transporter [Aspergillus cavernicola]|uniref:MFS general substrate transporter n=1 Tax=Aspergillus cavernicola TaxID=176166 RepID=A0ABR4I3E9_9EURO
MSVPRGDTEASPDVTATSEKKPTYGTFREILISALIVSSQLVQMIPYGSGVTAGLKIGSDIGASPIESTWIVASYPSVFTWFSPPRLSRARPSTDTPFPDRLTQGAFVLMGGRVGTVYGHKNTVVVAGIWWFIFHLISGFMRSVISLSLIRALSGIGGAFMVPNAIALLTITFPPGKVRNISVGLFGAMAPIGAAGGSVFGGIFGQLFQWKWLFFFLAILGAVVFTLFAFIVPGEGEPFDKGGRIDYIGAYFGVGGLILFNFVWNQAPAVGWDEPYEYALLIVSILHFVAFGIWESKFAKDPILPFHIWSAPSFGPMILAAFLAFMSVGIVIWYITVWNLEVRHYSLLSNSAAYATLAVCGVLAAIISAKVIPYLPAEYILAIGSLASCVSSILIATMPAQQVYWAQVFLAMIFTAFGPDFLFTAAQIIASNTVKRHQQGIAGSLIGTLLSYGLSTGLGFAGTVEAYTNNNGQNQIRGYRNALYLGIGLGAAAGILAVFFVRIPKDRREGWDEDEDVPTPV